MKSPHQVPRASSVLDNAQSNTTPKPTKRTKVARFRTRYSCRCVLSSMYDGSTKGGVGAARTKGSGGSTNEGAGIDGVTSVETREVDLINVSSGNFGSQTG